MIPVTAPLGGAVLVLGAGPEGLAAAASLRAGGAEVTLWDDAPEARAAAEAGGAALHPADPARPGALEGVGLVVIETSVPVLYPAPHPAVTAALEHGVPIDNSLGLFFRSFGSAVWSGFDDPPRVVALTGGGAGGCAQVLAGILTQTGREAILVPAAGAGPLTLEPGSSGQVIILEAEPAALLTARALTPDIAVYCGPGGAEPASFGGPGGLFAAHRRLFAEGGPDRAAIDTSSAEGRLLAGQLTEAAADPRIIRTAPARKPGGPGWDVFLRKGFLSEWRKGRQTAAFDMRAQPGSGEPGEHALAAYAAARLLGVAPREAADVLLSAAIGT